MSRAGMEVVGRAEATSPWGLVLHGVTKRWGPTVVLDAVDLQVGRGDLVWIGGNNGVGKTTLLRIASGLIRADAGHAEVLGLDPDRDGRLFHQHVALLTAGDRGLYARLTVRQNLDFLAGLAFLTGARRREAVDRAIDDFGLADLAKRRVDRMSMGQRQRLRIALTFVHDPMVVLLDEPRTSLDEPGSEVLGDAIRRLLARGGSVVWCSPSPEDAHVAVTTSYHIEGGKLWRQ